MLLVGLDEMQLEAQLLHHHLLKINCNILISNNTILKAIHEMFRPMCSRLIFALVKKGLLCTQHVSVITIFAIGQGRKALLAEFKKLVTISDPRNKHNVSDEWV